VATWNITTYPYGRVELERLIESGNEQAIIDALLSAASYEADWRWVQTTCLLDHPAKGVRWNAATGLEYIARIHRKLATEIVVPRLLALMEGPEIASNVEDDLEDIKWYLRLQ
jgi:hypothetical protein